MSKAYFEQEIRERASELGPKGMDNALCVGLLTMAAYASSARVSMTTQHVTQSLVPIHAELPHVATGYEYMFGKYSTGYSKSPDKLKVIRKIERYPGSSYTLLTYNPNTEEYGIINRDVAKYLSEEFGYVWNNEEIDSYKVGSTIQKDTVLYKSPAFDNDMNYCYGVNGKAVYVISQETIEDAIVVSESFAKKFETTYVEKCLVPLNDNDIPLNIYGTGLEYKSFPEIGERTHNNIIFASRKRNKTTDQFTLKNSNLRKLYPSDDIYQMPDNYFIADVDIWCNKPIDEISDLPAYRQVKEYYSHLVNYYTEIYEEFGKIINSGECKYTPEFSRLYAKAKDFLDPTCKFADDDGKIFSNIVMEFTIYKYEKIRSGTKLAGRCGNKSVVSKILPDDEIGTTEDGVQIDIRLDALGVLGRLNPQQLFDQELNWIAETVRERILAEDNYSEKFKLLYKFLDIASPNEANALRDYLANLSHKELKEWMDNTQSHPLCIIQSPMYGIDTDGLLKLCNEFKPQQKTIIYKDEYGNKKESLHKMIVADEYFIRLKQEAVTKFSVRSKSATNPRSGLPLRSTSKAKKKKVFSDQCNRIGEQELNILLISGDINALDYFFRSYSTSNEYRQSSTLFEDDPMNGFIINAPNDHNRAVDMLNTYLKAMGNELVMDYDVDDDAVVAECDSTIDLPDYIKNMI